MIAGLEPRPANRYPMAIRVIELAMNKRKTPKVQIHHEICIAILRPRLSAMKGMIKNPTNDPIKTIDCKMVDVLSHSKYG